MEQFSLEDFLKQHPVMAKYMEDNPLMGDLSVNDFSLQYWGGSVFSGIGSFTSLSQAYRSTMGATRSTLPQRVTSRAALKEEFTAMYREFSGETNFEKRCRLLLDLFKLQIIFVGMTYD